MVRDLAAGGGTILIAVYSLRVLSSQGLFLSCVQKPVVPISWLHVRSRLLLVIKLVWS